MIFSRRTALSLGAAFLAAPALAQASPWGATIARFAAFDQAHAVRILQNGQLVVAERVRGPGLSRAVPIKSVSKTIVAALLGVAIDREEISDVNATLGQTSPGLIPRAADPRVADITMSDLVTMQAGLERTSGANYGGWVSSSNWVANALSRPFVGEPGRGLLYSTGSYHVLGAVLANVSDRSLLSLARRRLGAPMGFDIPAWTRDPQGRYLGGNEMSLTLEAMTRFGEMYRQGGMFGQTRVLSADWVRASAQRRTQSQWSGLGYGYGWFLGRGGGTDYMVARGYGGQLIVVAPRVGLTMAVTSDPTRPARSGGYFGDLQRWIETQVLPTAQGQLG